jgi:hypothetical protein
VQTTCQPPSAWCKDPWPATIRDISTGGLSLALNRRFERGSGLAIELPAEDGTSSTVLARVANVQPGPDGYWVLGCRFISELSDEEVRSILDMGSVMDGSVDAPRPRPRPSKVPTVQGVLFQTRFAGEVLRWFVKRLDLSARWPLPEGKPASFQFAGPSSAIPPIQLTIKRCRRIGSYWIIDCKFRDTPSDEALRTLTTPSEEGIFA